MKRIIILSLLFSSCGVFHPNNFHKAILNENLLTKQRDSIRLYDVFNTKNDKKTLILIYASYCPFSKKSLEETTLYQKEHKEVNYIFLSVDHSYFDWKREVERIATSGKHYYMPYKGRGVIGRFLKIKKIPRFMILDKGKKIKVFNSSEISKLKKLLQ